MQLNILELYLNGFVIFFTIFELSTYYMNRIIHFELIEPLFKHWILHLLVYFETHITT